MSAPDGTVGAALTELLDDAVPAERARKASLEARGLAVITTSGAMVSLLLAIAALVTKTEGYKPPTFAVVLLIIAAVGYKATAVLGILCNVPGRYLDLDAASLESLASPDEWGKPGAQAAQELALARLKCLADWRQRNEIKGRLLVGAVAAQATGILMTAVAVAVVLLSSS